jgi:hypothetical protein
MRHHILFAALGQARPAAPTGSIRNDGKVKLICRSAGTGSGHAFAIGGVIRADKAAAVDAQVRHQAVAKLVAMTICIGRISDQPAQRLRKAWPLLRLQQAFLPPISEIPA